MPYLNARNNRVTGRPVAPTSFLFADNDVREPSTVPSSNQRSGSQPQTRSDDIEMSPQSQSERTDDLDTLKFDHESAIPSPHSTRVYSLPGIAPTGPADVPTAQS
ncbi:hypothetical protein VNI00_013720 [Paramarasmius palmivorus]|uniref:Uncharacterized protein n=1 Tax=Paramarasmius palmivorus TaxID=297713 RepID=A0AAW0BW99_9AGAR